MYSLVLTLLVILLPLNDATYLPTVFWDTKNPILHKKYWNEVVSVKQFDTLNFVCPYEHIKIQGTERRDINTLYHNLYVKEVPKDMKTFDGACDTSENGTARFIINCTTPKEIYYQNIPINRYQSDNSLPTFESGKDYMFFATTDGTKKSLGTKSNNCTIVFRIRFEDKASSPTCLLFGRKNVCENPSKPKDFPDCKDIIPQQIKTKTTSNSVTATWQAPKNPSCNITYYTICYGMLSRESCEEVLVAAKDNSVTLKNITADQTYFIKVRAHTSKGPGVYSKEIRFTTDSAEEPEISAKTGGESKSIDAKSIAIGFAVGVILTIGVVIAFWFVVTRIYKRKQNVDDEKDIDEQNKNNPRYCKEDEEDANGSLKHNVGYRDSIQPWKLPAVEEENVHLYSSDA